MIAALGNTVVTASASYWKKTKMYTSRGATSTFILCGYSAWWGW